HHHLRQIEARHVLDDLSASLRGDPVGAYEGDPDDGIAKGAIPRSPGAEAVRREEAADRPSFRERRIEGQALPVRPDGALQLGERDARLHDDDLVGGRMLDDAREMFRPEDGVESPGRPAQPERRPAADESDARSGARLLLQNGGPPPPWRPG